MIKEGSSAFGISISPASKAHKKVALFSKKGHFHHKGAAGFRKYPWRNSLQSGTSAFHGSCRTSTAKLRSRETLIKSLSDFTLEFLWIARNNLTRIASYLRKGMTKLCIKILVKADSAIESAFPWHVIIFKTSRRF